MSARGALARARVIAATLARFRRRRLAVRAWRVNYGEARTATLGVHDSRLGGVYAPFQMFDGIRGGFLVEWSDGRLSRGVLDGNAGEELEPVLEAACDARFRDDDARAFPVPARVHPVALHHPGIARLLDGRFGPLYDLAELLLERGRAWRARKIDGSVRASVGAHVVLSSAGLRHASLSSEVGFGIGLDGLLWESWSRRRPYRVSEARALVDRAARLLPVLRRGAAAEPDPAATVLILPGLAAELVEAYLVDNLYGSAVASGQSPFRAADFRRGRQVLREDLSLGIDPWVPFSSGSYRITSEGLPTRRERLIEAGRLRRPIAGVKYARRLGTSPTTPPASMESVVLAGGRTQTWGAALRGMERGFVAGEALGVHTQDTTSGDFSLTVPRAIVVRDGRLRGAFKAVLAGNLFEALRDPHTRLVRVPGHRFPALRLRASVAPG